MINESTLAMRKILLIFPLFILLVACKDDKWEDLTSHPILGSWEVVDYDITVKASNQELEKMIWDIIQEADEYIAGEVMTFHDNGKGESKLPDGTHIDFDYRIKGSTIETRHSTLGTTTSSFIINGDKLMVKMDGATTLNKELSKQGVPFRVEQFEVVETSMRIK